MGQYFVLSEARFVKIDEKLFNRNGPAAFGFGNLRFAVQGDKYLRQIGERFAGCEIAADGAHVAHADVGYFSFRFRQHRKLFSDDARGFEITMRHQSAYSEPSLRVEVDAFERRDFFDVDQNFRLVKPLFHQNRQMRAAGEDFGVAVILAKKPAGFAHRPRLEIFES